MMRHRLLILLFLGATIGNASSVVGQMAKVGVEERLGEVLPLETFTFTDENDKPIGLRELFDRPVVLTLVYFRCPSICTPLLLELSKNVNNCDLTPGEDFRLVTISFDPTEGAELAALKKANFIATVDKKEVSPDDWRWLTGDAESIKRLTDALGFFYIKDENKVDYIHAATVIFLSAEGKIVRYLDGTEFNPADLKLAVIDASEGRARSFMQRIQKLCYTYDPTSRGYILRLNRVILGITVVFVLGFGGYLLAKGGRRRHLPQESEGGTT